LFFAIFGFIASLSNHLKAFRVVINATNGERHLSKSPELLAFYCDAFLKKSSRNPVNYDIDEKLNKMVTSDSILSSNFYAVVLLLAYPHLFINQVTLFEYLDEKDVFLKFYSRLLAKRLINSTSSSLEAETQMISSLKVSVDQK
jgi:cullin 1